MIECFFSLKSNILYVTENSSQPSCLRILVSLEDKEEVKKKEKEHNPGFKMIKWNELNYAII